MDVGSIFNVNITEYKSTFCNYSFLTDSGGVRFNNGPPTKIKTPHEEEEDGKYFFLFQLTHPTTADAYKSPQSLGPAAYGLPSSIRQADSVPMVETTNRSGQDI